MCEIIQITLLLSAFLCVRVLACGGACVFVCIESAFLFHRDCNFMMHTPLDLGSYTAGQITFACPSW
jgi:hypothetical protein